MAISAGTVLLIATGGVLVYAGFTSQNPLSALREVASGKPSPVRDESGVDPASFKSSGGVAPGIGSGGEIFDASFTDAVAGGGLPALPRAVERYSGDRYSQAKRWASGYSDCSSFVGKGLKLIGVKPPGGSTTSAYLASKDWKRVPSSDVQAGDLAISLNHVIVCYGNGYAIGQQNSRRNVQRGKVSDLMYGNKPFVYLRYVAGTAKPKSAAT